MASLAPIAKQRFLDANGDPLASGKLYTYAAGTTTPLASYSDSAAATPNANPIILDSQGYATIYLSSSSYKFVLKNSADVTQWTQDNISLPTVDSGFSTGDCKFGIKTVADSGWVLMDDKTIGNAASSATGRANADTEALFTLLWTNTLDANCAVSTGRGASAAADYAANKTIALPKALGRAIVGAGVAGSGLTARALGAIFGTETHTLTEAQIPGHTHTFTGDAHGHVQRGTATAAGTGDPTTATPAAAGSAIYVAGTPSLVDMYATTKNTTSTGTNASTGGGTSHPITQPSGSFTIMIKL